MKRILFIAIVMLANVIGQASAESSSQVTSYAQSVLSALNARAADYEGSFAGEAEPFSGAVKLTVKLKEPRIVTVEPSTSADAMWHQGINEIAWAAQLSKAPEDLRQRFQSIQFSVVVTLDANHRYSFSSIKPLNGLMFVPFD